jgi:hypothetical protein
MVYSRINPLWTNLTFTFITLRTKHTLLTLTFITQRNATQRSSDSLFHNFLKNCCARLCFSLSLGATYSLQPTMNNQALEQLAALAAAGEVVNRKSSEVVPTAGLNEHNLALLSRLHQQFPPQQQPPLQHQMPPLVVPPVHHQQQQQQQQAAAPPPQQQLTQPNGSESAAALMALQSYYNMLVVQSQANNNNNNNNNHTMAQVQQQQPPATASNSSAMHGGNGVLAAALAGLTAISSQSQPTNTTGPAAVGSIYPGEFVVLLSALYLYFIRLFCCRSSMRHC